MKTACLSAGSASICAWESVITVLMSSCISLISILNIFASLPNREFEFRNFVGGNDAPVDQAGRPAQTQGEVPLTLEVVEPQQSTCLPVDPSEVRACSRRRDMPVRVLRSCAMNQVYQLHLDLLVALVAL